jgi:hypothetical protein
MARLQVVPHRHCQPAAQSVALRKQFTLPAQVTHCQIPGQTLPDSDGLRLPVHVLPGWQDMAVLPSDSDTRQVGNTGTW